MKKKGFTLIELLAVIVILAVIAVITVPMIMNVIVNVKVGVLEDSAYGLVESANLYYSENIQNLTDKVIFNFKDGKQISNNKLSYKGNIDNGKLILTTDGKIVLCIDDEVSYAYKDINETIIKSGKGTCSYNGETGNFEIVSNVDSLNNELKELRKIGNAFASEILEGKTALVGGVEVTGTMKNYDSLTITDNDGVTIIDSDNDLSATVKVPEGYYTEKSNINIPIETIKNNVSSLSSNFAFSSIPRAVDTTKYSYFPIYVYNEYLFSIKEDGYTLISKKNVSLEIKLIYTGIWGCISNYYIEKNGARTKIISSDGNQYTIEYTYNLDLNEGDTFSIYGGGDDTVSLAFTAITK